MMMDYIIGQIHKLRIQVSSLEAKLSNNQNIVDQEHRRQRSEERQVLRRSSSMENLPQHQRGRGSHRSRRSRGRTVAFK